jgi:outer membrane protein OmpA-like peptidoglycan-associated protein
MRRNLFAYHVFAVLTAAALAGCATPPPVVEKSVVITTPDTAAIAEANRKSTLLRSLRFDEVNGKWELVLPEPLLFAFDSYTLTPAAIERIREIGDSLLEANVREIVIVGHSDNVGARDYNERLSLRRAQSVAAALKLDALEKTKVVVMGVGSAAPIASNRTTEGRAENRRVSIIVEP